MNVYSSNTCLEELAKRMIALEDNAYYEFADIFGTKFKSYFLRHGLSDFNAEDLASTCITDIALKVGKYKQIENGNFEAWVFTLAHRALMDWFRENKVLQVQVPLADDIAVDDIKQENTELVYEVVDAVRYALSQLSEWEQIIIQLRDFDQLSYEEICNQLEITFVLARVRHHRALKHLEEILRENSCIKKLLMKQKITN